MIFGESEGDITAPDAMQHERTAALRSRFRGAGRSFDPRVVNFALAGVTSGTSLVRGASRDQELRLAPDRAPMTPADNEQLHAWRSALTRSALALTHDPTAADDLVQRTLERALTRGPLDSGQLDSPIGWLRAVMRNLFIDDLRRESRRLAWAQEESETRRSLEAAPAPHVGQLRMELEEGLLRIPAEMAEALVLVVVEGMSYAEVAELQNVAVGTVKSRVARAREALAAWFGPGTEPKEDAP